MVSRFVGCSFSRRCSVVCECVSFSGQGSLSPFGSLSAARWSSCISRGVVPSTFHSVVLCCGFGPVLIFPPVFLSTFLQSDVLVFIVGYPFLTVFRCMIVILCPLIPVGICLLFIGGDRFGLFVERS